MSLRTTLAGLRPVLRAPGRADTDRFEGRRYRQAPADPSGSNSPDGQSGAPAPAAAGRADRMPVREPDWPRHWKSLKWL